MKKKLNLLAFQLTFGLVFLGIQSCQPTKEESKESVEADTNLVDLKKIIEERTNQFTEAHITKDTTFLNNIFTKGARSFPPNAKALVGRKAIAQLNADWVNYGIYEAKETSTAFYGNNDYLIDKGTYTFIYREEKTTDKGKYINIWKKEDGEWKIDSNIWNSSLPE